MEVAVSGFRWSPEPEPPRIVRLGGAAAPADPIEPEVEEATE